MSFFVFNRFYENIYGAHPMATEIRDGKAHGIFLLTAHGLDVFTVEGRITFKIIGGVFEFYFFVPQDNKPNSVVQLFTDLVGKPMMICNLSFSKFSEIVFFIVIYNLVPLTIILYSTLVPWIPTLSMGI